MNEDVHFSCTLWNEQLRDKSPEVDEKRMWVDIKNLWNVYLQTAEFQFYGGRRSRTCWRQSRMQPSFVQALSFYGFYSGLQYLLRLGYDPDVMWQPKIGPYLPQNETKYTKIGGTPLSLALNNGHENVAHLLVYYGANITNTLEKLKWQRMEVIKWLYQARCVNRMRTFQEELKAKAWHPSRFIEWCLDMDERERFEKWPITTTTVTTTVTNSRKRKKC